MYLLYRACQAGLLSDSCVQWVAPLLCFVIFNTKLILSRMQAVQARGHGSRGRLFCPLFVEGRAFLQSHVLFGSLCF